MKLVKLNESFIKIVFDLSELELKKKIYNNFSYYIDGYRFMPQYKAGIFDGKYHFYNFNKSQFPLGLVHELTKYLDDEFIDYSTEGLDNTFDIDLIKIISIKLY